MCECLAFDITDTHKKYEKIDHIDSIKNSFYHMKLGKSIFLIRARKKYCLFPVKKFG